MRLGFLCCRRGNAVVELVIGLPILIMLGFGALDYSYYCYAKNTLQAASRDGARQAILPSATNASVTAAIQADLQAAGLGSSGYVITLSPANMTGLPSGQAITVTVSCSWATMGLHALPTVMGGIGNGKQVVGVTVMHRE